MNFDTNPFTDKKQIRLTCDCGGIKIGHYLGQPNCYRTLVRPEEEPKFVGSDCSCEPKCVEGRSCGVADRWEVMGHEIPGFTLRQQRGHYQHENRRWSRSSGGSTNSLDWKD